MTAAHPIPMTDNLRPPPLLVVAITVLALLAGLWFASEGVRGTDQYTYLSDVETLAQNQPPLSNLYFPAKLLREGTDTTPNYFSHNGPLMQLVAMLSRKFDSYSSWIAINLASHLVVAGALFWVIGAQCNRSIAAWTTLLYLASPIAFWQSANILQEQFFAAVLALILFGYTFRHTGIGELLLITALALGILAHPLFIAPALLYPLLGLFITRKPRTILRTLLLIAALAIMLYLKSHSAEFYPSIFQPSLEIIITSAVPGGSNVFWHFAEYLPELNAELLINKFKVAALKHVFDLRHTAFYFYTNMAFLALGYLLLFHYRRYREQIFVIGLFLGLYAAIIVLQQNHARFQQIIAPASFLAIALALHHVTTRYLKPALVCLLFLTVAFDALLAKRLHDDSQLERTDLATIVKHTEFPVDARIAMLDVKPHGPLARAFRPLPVLTVWSSMLTEVSVERAFTLFDPSHILSVTTLPPQLKTLFQQTGTIDSRLFGQVGIYKQTTQKP